MPTIYDTSGRLVVIPGSRQRKRRKQTSPPRRMNPRLRHAIVLATLLLVVVASLISLTPLANGQKPFPLFQGITKWLQTQQLNWQLQLQDDTFVQNPPPMTLPRSQYVAIAQQDAINAGIPPDYFVRQINLESGFNPNAVSSAGAVGIAQFLPSTAAGLGINPWNPIQALQGAARLMASYARQFGGDYAKALAAYNAGTGAVQRAVNYCGGNWISCLPPETRNYLYAIMGI